MPKVEYSPKALEDLQYINDYIMTKYCTKNIEKDYG
ncbi:plasmid stabilization system protein ParE [Mesobacillus stamsii]|uniref:Plasmid stabilization system protein ParE n=1 Tax=Mesobacillus stamsii TaxID=225347 RepID=A0ABU0G0M7_9BACI|nr:plasmid stabilization system protein ParE [Mesobacillus stamsii]